MFWQSSLAKACCNKTDVILEAVYFLRWIWHWLYKLDLGPFDRYTGRRGDQRIVGIPRWFCHTIPMEIDHTYGSSCIYDKTPSF